MLIEEKAGFKQKLLYAMLGSILVISWQLLPKIFVHKATAQIGNGKESAEFDMGTCRSLKIIDAHGQVWAKLEAENSSADQKMIIQVLNASGVPVYQTGTVFNSGFVKMTDNNSLVRAEILDFDKISKVIGVILNGNDGKIRTGMLPSSEGGTIWIYGKDGSSKGVVISPLAGNGGGIAVAGKDNQSGAVSVILASEAKAKGGTLVLQNHKGNICSKINIVSNGGAISIGKNANYAGIEAHDFGGFVGGFVYVNDHDEKARASMKVLSSGGGDVSVRANNDATHAVLQVMDKGVVGVLDNNGNTIDTIP